MNINERIKEIRNNNKLTLEAMGKMLNWPISKISKIESGEQKISFDEVKEVSDALGIEMVKLIGKDEIVIPTVTKFKSDEELKSLLGKVAEDYIEQVKGNFSGSEVGKLVTKELPRTIIQKANIDSKKYRVEGSIGKGQFAEIPWISVFRKDITETATKGIYIVYLYTADMKGVYLSLNQGFTFFREKFGTKKGREEIRKVASFLQSSCNTIPKELKLDVIDLKATGVLGKGYVPGHIAGKYYDINDLPTSNKLADDLRNLMSVYEEISGIIGNRTIDQFYDFIIANQNGALINDDELSEKVEEIIKKGNEQIQPEYNGSPKDKKEPVKDRQGAEKYPRDPQVAAKALAIAGYVCENDKQHITFTRKSNRKNYTEPHHLIPISVYKDFKYSLDIEENICSLCSTCHNCLHYGIDTEREIILKKLYEERKEMLIKVGLEISFEQLKNYYNIK